MNIENSLPEFEQEFPHRMSQVMEELWIHTFHEPLDHFTLGERYDCGGCPVPTDVDVPSNFVLVFSRNHAVRDHFEECRKHLLLSEPGNDDSRATPRELGTLDS